MWRTEGQLSATLAVQGCMNFSQQKEVLNGLIQVNDDEERKGGKAESLWLSGTWSYPIRAYKLLRVISVMFPVYKAYEPHSSMKNSCTLLFQA